MKTMTEALNEQKKKFQENLERIGKEMGVSKIGITRKNKSKSKKNLKIEAKSRKVNRNKKRHIKTAKEKKSS